MTDNNDNNDNNKRVLQLEKIQTEARDLFSIKNKDYGDAFAAYGPVGVLVRIGDKINVFKVLINQELLLLKTKK